MKHDCVQVHTSHTYAHQLCSEVQSTFSWDMLFQLYKDIPGLTFRGNGKMYLGSSKNLVEDDIETLGWTGDMYQCLVFDADQKDIQWSNCSSDHRFTCMNKNGRVEIFKTYNRWIWNMIFCTNHKRLIVKPDSLYGLTVQGPTQLWTGVIRRLTTFLTPVPINSVGFRQGYIEYKNNEFVLQFSSDMTEMLQALCITEADSFTTERVIHNTSTEGNGKSGTTIQTKTTEENGNTGTTIQTKTTQGNGETSTTIQTKTIEGNGKADTTIQPKTTDGNDQSSSQSTQWSTTPHETTLGPSAKTSDGDGGKTNLYTVVLGIAIPVTVVAVVTIVIICIWRNRRSRKEGHNSKPSTSDLSGHINEAMNLSSPHAKRRGAPTSEPTHNYTSVLSGTFNINNDDEYDTADSAGARTVPVNDTNNVYNRLQVDSMYSHVDNATRKVNNLDNVYNTTTQDDMYDKTTETKGNKSLTDNVYSTAEQDDVYNKLSGTGKGKGRTDNIYNRTETDETYDTTTDKGHLKVETDNVYNTTTPGDVYS